MKSLAIPLLLLSGSVLAEECATAVVEYHTTEGWNTPNISKTTIDTHGVGAIVLLGQHRERDSITIMNPDATGTFNSTQTRVIIGNHVLFPGSELLRSDDYTATYKLCPDGSITNLSVK